MCLRGHLGDIVLYDTDRCDQPSSIGPIDIVSCFQQDELTNVAKKSGKHVTLELRCAPKSLNLYTATPPIQMHISCQQSSSIPTDFAIPASQLPQTARNLESLIAEYQKGIGIAMGIGQCTLVRYTMMEASRQAKNVGDIRRDAERSTDDSSAC